MIVLGLFSTTVLEQYEVGNLRYQIDAGAKFITMSKYFNHLIGNRWSTSAALVIGLILVFTIDEWDYYIPIMIFYTFVCGMLVRHRNVSFQRSLDERSRSIKKRLLSRVEGQIDQQSIPRYALFLRPFDIDQFTLQPNLPGLFFYFVPFGFKLGDRTIGFNLTPEGALAETVENKMLLPLVSVATPSDKSTEVQGVGRVSLNDEWKSEIVELLHYSQIVFILPSKNEGTMYEYNLIVSNESLVVKTVFLVPPLNSQPTIPKVAVDALEILKNTKFFSQSDYWGSWKQEWDAIAEGGRSVVVSKSGPMYSKESYDNFYDLLTNALELRRKHEW